MRVVAVTQRVDVWQDRGERRDAVDQKLLQWVSEAGYLPVTVPNALSLERLKDWLSQLAPSAFLLSGGNDVGEAAERDRTEGMILRHAEENGLPVLGICRGMQFIAVDAGATLQRLDGHVATHHDIAPEPGEEERFPDTVNSYHGWGMYDAPPGFKTLARTRGDGSVEAIGHESLSWEGWMWHPEREQEFCALQISRLKALFG